jgi:CRP-like cAMP-binding protein
MYIVFSGMLEICTEMDNGTQFIIEILPEGSILNPIAFLIEDDCDTINKAGSSCVIYKLDVERFIEEACKFPDFAFRTALLINGQLSDRENAIALDYITGDRFLIVNNETWDLEKSERARKALLALKNTIYYFILNNRQERKMPKLKEILY